MIAAIMIMSIAIRLTNIIFAPLYFIERIYTVLIVRLILQCVAGFGVLAAYVHFFANAPLTKALITPPVHEQLFHMIATIIFFFFAFVGNGLVMFMQTKHGATREDYEVAQKSVIFELIGVIAFIILMTYGRFLANQPIVYWMGTAIYWTMKTAFWGTVVRVIAFLLFISIIGQYKAIGTYMPEFHDNLKKMRAQPPSV